MLNKQLSFSHAWPDRLGHLSQDYKRLLLLLFLERNCPIPGKQQPTFTLSFHRYSNHYGLFSALCIPSLHAKNCNQKYSIHDSKTHNQNYTELNYYHTFTSIALSHPSLLKIQVSFSSLKKEKRYATVHKWVTANCEPFNIKVDLSFLGLYFFREVYQNHPG